MKHRLRRIFARLGPGFITGASDDDPSGIATYTQVGAMFGFGLLWTTLLNLPLMIAIQEMVARIGMVTGQGLVASLRKHYPWWVRGIFILLIFGANTVNIGADLGAMADAVRTLVPMIPFAFALVAFTALILFLEIFISYKTYAKILKWFAFVLVSYVITALLVTTDWMHVFRETIFPTIHWNRDLILAIVAVMGTTISPYLFIWQTSEEVEEEIANGRKTIASRKGATHHELHEMRMDVAGGMTISQVITYCIIVTSAMVFFRHGLHAISTTQEAAQALTPLAGRFASTLYAIGVIGTGLLAIPVLSASASYALSDGLGWSNGLYKKLRRAHGFYGAITIATLVGLVINFIGMDPIKALYLTAVLNGIVTPPLVAIILSVANHSNIMGKHVNSRLSNIFGSLTFVLTSAMVVLLFLM